MRLHLTLSQNTSPVPFTYQVALTGAFHKWLGENNVHGDLALHSFSWLANGKRAGKDGLNFPNGSSFFISAFDNELIKKLVDGIMKDPVINWGMEVTEMTIQPNPHFGEEAFFHLASPALIKRSLEAKKEKHYTYKDTEADGLMTETMLHKLKKAELADEPIEIAFDRDYAKATTKLIEYKGIKNRTSLCPIIVKGSPAAIAFAWNVGVGNSTGVGFGGIK